MLGSELDAELKAIEERQAEIQQSMTKENTGWQDKEDEIKPRNLRKPWFENEVTQAKAAVAHSADRIKAMELDKQVTVKEVGSHAQ
ncbi:hypothetical protein SeLEV6574_g02145 [Synchytrium endobioticum]|uniref:Uncharacterized protein n=1 Tax=Synchytrium endobioticum TaxID=286115 RepID=A0A507D9U4_9FUNG|nr:hypothetical protein SeLEV6574_g02145 [Synchytrium endobioticum]